VHSVMVRCLDCDIPQYEPLNATMEYKVLTTTYLATGGDGYSMFPGELTANENLGGLWLLKMTNQRSAPLSASPLHLIAL